MKYTLRQYSHADYQAGREHEACEPGSEEPLDSEKYQLRRWDLDRPDSLRDYIACLNRIRQDNPALQSDWSLRFHMVDNPFMLCYSKSAGGNALTDAVEACNMEADRLSFYGWL